VRNPALPVQTREADRRSQDAVQNPALPVQTREADRRSQDAVQNPALPVQTREAVRRSQDAVHPSEARNEAPKAQRAWPEWTGARTALLALPPEAQEVFEVMAKGGPFRYSRDGIEFQNRERLLPAKPRGYYREYTVPTPGERDRGARRIIAGQAGEKFYTDDHYDSFRLIE
jgi:guanyl-specific ribonuclease Sa